MRQRRAGRGFTLVELLIVLVVMAMVAVLFLPAMSKSRGYARRTSCLSNARQIGIALQGFFHANDRYPEGDLHITLNPYISSGHGLFKCPLEKSLTQVDSYSDYYCPRWERKEETFRYVISCPRHTLGNTRTATVLFSLGEAGVSPLREAKWNGNAILPGVEAVGGVLSFADGSRSTIVGIHRATLITSFALKGRHCYTVLKVKDGDQGDIDNEVTPGSKFEVITPAAVAGVEGTRFSVRSAVDAEEKQRSTVTVNTGAVRVTGFAGKTDVLSPGASADYAGPTCQTVSGATTPPLPEGLIFLRDRYYHRKVANDTPLEYFVKYSEWDSEKQKPGSEVGRERWQRNSAVSAWIKTQDTFAAND